MKKTNVTKVKDELIRTQYIIRELTLADAWRQGTTDYIAGPEAAALRRASLDLTKALAKLRNERG
jgi:hypothetical protein